MKKQYMKPTMQVVVLQHDSYILAGSPAVTSLTGELENIEWEEDGLDDTDILR